MESRSLVEISWYENAFVSSSNADAVEGDDHNEVTYVKFVEMQQAIDIDQVR